MGASLKNEVTTICDAPESWKYRIVGKAETASSRISFRGTLMLSAFLVSLYAQIRATGDVKRNPRGKTRAESMGLSATGNRNIKASTMLPIFLRTFTSIDWKSLLRVRVASDTSSCKSTWSIALIALKNT